MIIAVRAGTSVVSKLGLGRGVNAGAAVELLSDSGVDAGVGAEVVRASVAEVPQANTPITNAMNGEASSRDIFRLLPIRPRWR